MGHTHPPRSGTQHVTERAEARVHVSQYWIDISGSRVIERGDQAPLVQAEHGSCGHGLRATAEQESICRAGLSPNHRRESLGVAWTATNAKVAARRIDVAN